MKHLTIFLMLLVGLALTSCRTREQAFSQAVQQVRTDTLRIFQFRADTLRLHDSIFVREQIVGETIRIEKHHWHTAWQTRVVRDTVFATRTDTLRFVEKQKERTSSAPSFSPICYAFMAVVVASVAYIFIKRIRNGLS
ncbi:MAG: hypothetical protein U0L68_06395 [Prevotellamassilia sp.]|nr:hypothetical protein [Prevotellamassilia sp.]